MDSLNIAILGCGTVGGGVARILTEMKAELTERTGRGIKLSKIVELKPGVAADKFNLPLDLFCGGGRDLSPGEAGKYIDEILASADIDLVLETIGGTSDFVYNLAVKVCESGKHLVTANKALLAERGKGIFDAAKANNVVIGYEAAVCGAIPVIKTIKESFTGDSIESVSGIMNGTSNYIMSMMKNEGLEFDVALKLAQENGYAEADPTLDINGGDAAHKLIILMKLCFGVDVRMDQLSMKGIENVGKADIEFADEIGSTIKLICFAKKSNGKIYATVSPMMVKNVNLLAEVDGATNAVKFVNKYSGEHVLIGAGAGSLETASAIVGDMVFIARYADTMRESENETDLEFVEAGHFKLPYIITFETGDFPGVTGLITTAIGNQKINIDTVSHNRHMKDKSTFSIATTPCTKTQIGQAIEEIERTRPGMLLGKPKIIPILY